jgi:PIN domain nuclease of toxin-antitoxin system
MNVLLDTCTFLWAVSAPAQLSARARDAIASPANAVYVSSVSAWEIAVKHGLGRLTLTSPPDRFVQLQREAHGFETLPVDEASALHVSRLPALHRDPFDRLLVCQAIVHGLAILTPDPLVEQYPARVVW